MRKAIPGGPRVVVQNGRATVSLGALTASRHCTYRCPFCYVTKEFEKGGHTTPDTLIEALRSHDPAAFEVILVSGDTDSFAPPRTAQAVELLEAVTTLGKNVAFTTRAVLGSQYDDRLAACARRLAADGLWLSAQASLTQWSRPHLEPHPIPTTRARVEQMARFRALGLHTGAALRPLLPSVPLTDYTSLLTDLHGVAEYALIGTWFRSPDEPPVETTQGMECLTSFVTADTTMDFDSNTARWIEIRSFEAEEHCESEGRRLGIPVFRRSRLAFDWLSRECPPVGAFGTAEGSADI